MAKLKFLQCVCGCATGKCREARAFWVEGQERSEGLGMGCLQEKDEWAVAALGSGDLQGVCEPCVLLRDSVSTANPKREDNRARPITMQSP